MKLFTKEVKIGITGIVALAMLILGINYLIGINLFKPSAYFYVKYTNINGLTKSSPVYADGYKVGVVHDIIYDYNRPGHITVQIEVDTQLRVPRGSHAELESEILGGVKMNLKLAPFAGAFYEVGDTLPGQLNNGFMDALSETLQPQLDSMLPKLDSILTSLNTLLGDENIPATLASVKSTAANLEVLTGQVNVLFNREIPLLTGKLNTIGENFVDISGSLASVDYASTFAKVDSTLYNVKRLTESLHSSDNTVGLLLTDPSLYNNLSETMGNASTLLEDLRLHPKRYVHFSLFGRKAK